MELLLQTITSETNSVGLKININKTKCMRLNVNNETLFTIDNSDIENVEQFNYHGSAIPENSGADTDMVSRIRKVQQAIKISLGHASTVNTN